jgi:hypothetical protein
MNSGRGTAQKDKTSMRSPLILPKRHSMACIIKKKRNKKSNQLQNRLYRPLTGSLCRRHNSFCLQGRRNMLGVDRAHDRGTGGLSPKVSMSYMTQERVEGRISSLFMALEEVASAHGLEMEMRRNSGHKGSSHLNQGCPTQGYSPLATQLSI